MDYYNTITLPWEQNQNGVAHVGKEHLDSEIEIYTFKLPLIDSLIIWVTYMWAGLCPYKERNKIPILLIVTISMQPLSTILDFWKLSSLNTGNNCWNQLEKLVQRFLFYLLSIYENKNNLLWVKLKKKTINKLSSSIINLYDPFVIVDECNNIKSICLLYC